MSDAVEPWLSVQKPVFTGADTRGAALQSVAEQSTWGEVIPVDQGSKDDSCQTAEAFGDKIDLRIVSTTQDENWVENTNLALNMSRSDRATTLHGSRKTTGPLIAVVLILGPSRWVQFLCRMQLVNRVWPRIRLLRGGTSM